MLININPICKKVQVPAIPVPRFITQRYNKDLVPPNLCC